MSLPAADTSKIVSRVTSARPAVRRGGGVFARVTLGTRLAIAMILVVAVAVIAVGWLNYRSLEQALLPRVLDRIEARTRLMAAELESHAAGARRDIASYRFIPGFPGLIRARMAGGADPSDGVPFNVWRERIGMHFTAELESKPAYAMIRLIGVDDNQREIIRIDRSGRDGAVRVVPDPELRSGRGDRDYYKEAIGLAPGQIYVSPVNLDHHDGGERRTPMLRLSTPIFAPDGKPFGVLVLNVDMSQTFRHIQSTIVPGAQLYVVNAQGEYLVHPDAEREFTLQRGRQANNWQADFPSLASSVGSTQSTAQIVLDEAGQRGGMALAPALLAGKEWVGVIETVPNAVFMAPALAIRNTTLQVGLVAMLCAAVLAVILARSLTRPINQLTVAVEGMGRNDPVPIPLDAGGETGVLARAFARMIGEANAKTTELEREIREHRFTEAARDLYAARERLYSAAVQSSNDAIITQALDGTITGWNPAAQRLFGYSAEEAVGRNIGIIMPTDRAAEVKDILRRVERGERIEHYETVRLRKDGSSVQVSLSISPIKSPSGEIIGASRIARDLTESRRTEQALRQQIEERRRIFETSQDLILITDSKGVMVQVSPSAESILGYLPEEMIGRNTVDFLHPDDIERGRNYMRAARSQQPTRDTPGRFIHKDGRTVWLSWMGAWSEPVQRHFFVGRDMTDSRLAQESLRESAQLARNIVETALDAFVQMDEKGAIRSWNSQADRMFGWSRKEVLGKDLLDLVVADEDRDEFKAALGRFLFSGQGLILGRRRELMVRRRDGREFKAELSVTAMKIRGGFLFNGFFRDLTDKIATEERIRQSEKMEAIGQLTGGIAHDFNNILTVITGTIEILAGAVAKEPQLAAITKMIDEAAARGADLTQHLLAFARRQPLQPREIDINTLIIDTARLLRPTLGEHIEIESVFKDETCPATVDPNQLATAILNLALNSRDAMPNGGKLILETGSAYLDEAYAKMHDDVQPGRYALIAVSDTGNGIPSAILDKVFNPFFTSKGPGKGTGLGLSMVYGFIKQSAGHIKIYSEEGHGTTIKMYLPPGTGAALTPETVAVADIDGGHETILVVEDDTLVRGYVLTQLHSLGYVTLDAANAAEALALIEAGHDFDLLFTDVIMPGAMNGRQLADAIQIRRPELKVLYTSGYTENAIIHHGRLDSGVLLLAKPYRKSDLAKMIRKALEG
jgi:PAS domain S-box-containing protein